MSQSISIKKILLYIVLPLSVTSIIYFLVLGVSLAVSFLIFDPYNYPTSLLHKHSALLLASLTSFVVVTILTYLAITFFVRYILKKTDWASVKKVFWVYIILSISIGLVIYLIVGFAMFELYLGPITWHSYTFANIMEIVLMTNGINDQILKEGKNLLTMSLNIFSLLTVYILLYFKYHRSQSRVDKYKLCFKMPLH